MRSVHDVATDDCFARLSHVVPDVFKQARFTGFFVGFDFDTGDLESFVAGLDDCFHTVAEFRDDVELDQRVTGVSAEATGGVG